MNVLTAEQHFVSIQFPQLIALDNNDMRILDNVHRQPGMHHSVCGFHSSDLGGSCFGWTYDQLGWDMVKGGIMCS